ncbi:fibronectin type III domain-containing protein [Chryseobacterium sp.]|uniref:fibronectin type III domain-containing protein n=1 Tax=Chryseobacterium sp. TaxID=1871047 RepID=UPI001629A045|nr:fibronectin type III domain-containing protein [Chryseobacterium sp.]
MFLLGFSGSSLKAQVSLYSFSSSMGTYTEITGGTVLATATGNTSATSLDAGIYAFTPSFTFFFNGAPVTNISVNTNGFLTFGAVESTPTTATPISGSIAYDGAVSAFSRNTNAVFDIAGRTGEIRWETVGTAPNREMVIQWKNFRPSQSTSVTEVYVLSYQIRLKETSNAISVVYAGGTYLAGSAAITFTLQNGLRGATNADFNNRMNATSVKYMESTAGTANSSTQNFNTVNDPPGMPAAGFTYTWLPPTCLAPTAVNVNPVTATTATVNWTASSTPASSGYDVYFSTVNTAPTGSTVLDASNSVSVPSAAVSALIPGLAPGTNYFVWVRSKCSALDQSAWTAVSVPFTTPCIAVSSLFENFDSYATGSIVPNCWARIVPATTPGTQTISSTSPFSGTRNLVQTTTAAQTPLVVVLSEFSNINAGTHWLRMKVRVSSLPGTLDVGYVTNAADASTFVSLQTLNITNTAYSPWTDYMVTVPTSVPAGARLATRTPSDGKSYYYDDVYWEQIPSCMVPTSVTVTAQAATSAQISWTPPSSVPAQGYDVYYSTSNVAPVSTTVPQLTQVNSPTTITNLQPVTQYYVWVRSRCSSTDQSAWTPAAVYVFSTCAPPAITSTTPATVCPNNTATLSATADSGATIHWYDGGGAEVGTGPSYTTPTLTTTTTYYATASVGTGNIPVGKTTFEPSPTSGSGVTNFGLVFDVLSPFTLSSVTIYPISSTSASGTVTIDVIDGNNNILHTVTVNTTGAPIASAVAQVVNLGFTMLPGTNYKIRPRGFTGISGLAFDPSANAPGGSYNYPFTVPGVVSINTSTLSTAPANTARNDLYYYFYDWKISTKCESASQPVVATVDSACLSTSETGKEKLQIYPNPFTDIITISDVRDLKSITVLDMTGRVVKTILKPASKINLSELKTGIYLLNLTDQNGSTQVIKVMKK